MMRLTALLLCTALLSGCTTAGALRSTGVHDPAHPQRTLDHALMVEYVQGLSLGTKVKVERAGGGPLTGTLMKASDEYIVVQRRTRLPEPPDQIAMDEILRVTPESTNGIAKALGIGAAAGGAAALSVFLVILAIYAD